MSTIDERLAIVQMSTERKNFFVKEILTLKKSMLEEIRIRDEKLNQAKPLADLRKSHYDRKLAEKIRKSAKHITLHGFEKKLKNLKQKIWHDSYRVCKQGSTIGIPELRLCFECDSLSKENLHAEIIMVSSGEKMGAIFQRVFTGKPCTILLPKQHVEYVEKVIRMINDHTNPMEEKKFQDGSICVQYIKQHNWHQYWADIFHRPSLHVYPDVSTPEDLIDELEEFVGEQKISQEILDKIVEGFKLPTCRFVSMSREGDKVNVYIVCGDSPCKIVGYYSSEHDVGKYTVKSTKGGFVVSRGREILVSYNKNIPEKVKLLIMPEFVEAPNADFVVITGKCQQKIMPLWYTVLR
jgi:hypothetical protein